MALRKILKVSRIKPSQWKKKRHADDAGGREGGSWLHLSPQSRKELPKDATDQPPPGGRFCGGPSPLETSILRNCQAGGAQASACTRGTGNPCQSPPRPLSGPALPAAPRCVVVLSRAQFDTEGTTQLPPGSPREQNSLSVCQRPPPLPGPLQPPCSLPRGNGEAVRPTLCGNPRAGVLMSCPQLRASLSVPGILLPPCGRRRPLGSPQGPSRPGEAETPGLAANSWLRREQRLERQKIVQESERRGNPEEFSKCGPWTSTISIAWELTRNADSQIPPWVYRIKKAQQAVFTSTPGDSEAHQSLRTTGLESKEKWTLELTDQGPNLGLAC